MDKNFLKLKNIKLSELPDEDAIKIESVSKKDIAVIGIAGKFAEAEDVDGFWDILKTGKDCIREFPSHRKEDIKKYLSNIGIDESQFDYEYMKAAYMDHIDNFDYNFFSISPKEAKLMDPCQKMFLETVWSAIEDAGYGGKKMYGTRTAVFVGQSNDFGEEYRRFVQVADSSLMGFAAPGNVKSIIASRISYLLDLKGPSVIVDTACSSGLMAIHLACRSIRLGESEMAIAGGIKVHILPIKGNNSEGVGTHLIDGIESKDGRARTFDDHTTGTGLGEGVGAVILKPLNDAIRDNDNIYAVIKGSYSNQDGCSVGITAPNSAAQEDMILNAWKDAGIDPETISYIEAHGTGTKLGDPIEISGIERAFKKYTDKKQFCAVGSVKTNIGHLDNAAGISGFMKMVLSLKNKQLPPSLHFSKPNKNINFVSTPIYVNDMLKKWEVHGSPRRCGVSSFGLSGTNCHVILEEAPTSKQLNIECSKSNEEIFTLSAKSEDVLKKLIEAYKLYFSKGYNDIIGDICYTANTGRGHYGCRLILKVKDRNDLKNKIDLLSDNGIKSFSDEGIFYNEHIIAPPQKKNRTKQEISEDEKAQLTLEAKNITDDYNMEDLKDGSIIDRICDLYIKGADVEWENLYKGQIRKKVRIPTYIFEKNRCWIDIGKKADKSKPKPHSAHPLIGESPLESIKGKIFTTKFKVDTHWVLSEHRVMGSCVVPGTTYLEMARAAYFDKHHDLNIQLANVMFLSPLIVEEDGERDVQIIIDSNKSPAEFIIASKDEAETSWLIHAEGKIEYCDAPSHKKVDMNQLVDSFGNRKIEFKDIVSEGIVAGKRWENTSQIYVSQDEYLILLELNNDFIKDLEQYYIHPSLFDNAMNAANRLIGQGLYLPLSYKNIKLYGRIPHPFYSYIKKKNKHGDNFETVSFDVMIIDKNGNVVGEVEDYTIKKVNKNEAQFRESSGEKKLYFKTSWVCKDIEDNKKRYMGSTLILKDKKGLASQLINQFLRENIEVIEVEAGTKYEKLNDNRYFVGSSIDDYLQLFSDLKHKNIDRIIHMLTIEDSHEISNVNELDETQSKGVYSLFNITKALISNKYKNEIDLVLISDLVNEVTKQEDIVKPHNATLFGLGKIVTMEHPNLFVRCIDIDHGTTIDRLIFELENHSGDSTVAYRNNLRYVEEFETIDIDKLSGEDIEIKDDGVYIITGGTGGIGLEFGNYLASKNKVNIALVNRSKMPDKGEWDNILKDGQDQNLCDKIGKIMNLEAQGTSVECISADISSFHGVKEMLLYLRSKYGKINGIIHCAGVAGDGFIIRKELSNFKNVLSPKVNGTWILDNLTRNDEIDFFVMFSSVTSVQHNQGQGDYTAANCYLDSYSALRSKGKRGRTLSINWPAWSETGMAVNFGVKSEGNIFKSIGTLKAMNAFERVMMKTNLPRTFIGEMNYSVIKSSHNTFFNMLSADLKNIVLKKDTGAKAQQSTKKEYDIIVEIKGKEESEITEIDVKLAKIWAIVLELKEIDVYQSFYNVGGDSILATQLLKLMEKEFDGLVDISDIFTYSSIAEMSSYLNSKFSEKNNKEKKKFSSMDEILEKLAMGEIAPDQVDELIKELEVG